MNDKNTARIHWSFWVISIIMLIWNVMGSINFVVQMMNAEMVASMSEIHRAIIEGRPLWATGGFAIAVFAGALGCLLLLIKNAATIIGMITIIIRSEGAKLISRLRLWSIVTTTPSSEAINK